MLLYLKSYLMSKKVGEGKGREGGRGQEGVGDEGEEKKINSGERERGQKNLHNTHKFKFKQAAAQF